MLPCYIVLHMNIGDLKVNCKLFHFYNFVDYFCGSVLV